MSNQAEKKLIKDGSKSWPSSGRHATHATRWPSWTWCTSKRLEHAVKRSCRKSSYHWHLEVWRVLTFNSFPHLEISTLHLSSDVLVPIGAIQCCQSSYRSSLDLLRMIPMMDSAESSDDRWCLQPSRWLPKEGAPSQYLFNHRTFNMFSLIQLIHRLCTDYHLQCIQQIWMLYRTWPSRQSTSKVETNMVIIGLIITH